MNENDNAYGVFGIIVVVALVGWAVFSNSQQQQNETNTTAISSAVSDTNDKIEELFSSAATTKSNVDEECSWQSENLSGNIGEVCSNNTVDFYTIDSLYDYQLSESDYTSALEDGTSIENVISKIVDDANTNYDRLLSTMNNMIAALGDQCNWIDDNIDTGIADECHQAESFGNFNESPFNTSDYIEAE